MYLFQTKKKDSFVFLNKTAEILNFRCPNKVEVSCEFQRNHRGWQYNLLLFFNFIIIILIINHHHGQAIFS